MKRAVIWLGTLTLTAGTALTPAAAHADDPRVDVTSITVSAPNPAVGAKCQSLTVTATWAIAAGFSVGSAVAVIANANPANTFRETIDLTPGSGNVARRLYLYCPSLNGYGTITIGPTSVSFFPSSYSDQGSATDSTTGSFSYAAPLKPTTSQLVVTRPDAGSLLEFDISTKAAGVPNNQPVVHLQQRIGAASWVTVHTSHTTKGHALVTLKSKAQHAYRLVVPASTANGTAGNTSATAIPTVTGARPATAAERSALLRVLRTSKWFRGTTPAGVKLTDPRVSTTNPAWAEASVTTAKNGSLPMVFHYSSGRWRTAYNGAGCPGVPAAVRTDLGNICG